MSGSHFVRRLRQLAADRMQMRRLASINRRSTAALVQPGGPVVSLTSHGPRVENVFYTIESIAAGSLKPSRFILWLDEPIWFDAMPDSLRRLRKRGLEIVQSVKVGPHGKYYPYVSTEPNLELPLVTADDDVMYPLDWLRTLSDANDASPNDIIGLRLHHIDIDSSGAMAPYNSWGPCLTTVPSLLNFPTGTSGMLYPLRMQMLMRDAGMDFMSVTPKNDDIWIHALALRAGVRLKQVFPLRLDYPSVRGSYATSLMRTNVLESQNDLQIAAVYTESDLELLRQEFDRENENIVR